MDNNSAFQTQPAYIQKSSNRKRLVIIFLVIFVLVIVALGALYLLGSSAKKPPIQPTAPVPTQTPLASPTPASASAQVSPTAEVTTAAKTTPATKATPTPAKTALSISVLNGSGTPGAAGQTASALKSAGYTNITTGNASAYTYTGITIHVKDKNNLASVEKAIQDANPSVKITTGVDPTLASDVEVIVGK